MEQKAGYFGAFGGRFVGELLVPALQQLEEAWLAARNDEGFQRELGDLLQNYAGRPTPLTLCRSLLKNTSCKLYLKREDLLHGGAHKTNQVLAQALLAKRMGKTEIIAETGAGQHGTATAMACALLGLNCRVYMGTADCARQQANLFRMKLLGAQVIPVSGGAGTLKEAVNEALRDWSANYQGAHYLLGTAAGPHPYPAMVRDFQRVIGVEARRQIQDREGRLPDAVIACVGGGSNAIGIFHPFIEDSSVRLIGVEAGGKGLQTGEHGASLTAGREGILHGSRSYVLQSEEGQILESQSVSAGLDYPGVGPEHAWLKDSGRAHYTVASDEQALYAFQQLACSEGILPALESAHALAEAMRLAKESSGPQLLLVNLSGRGDKDLELVNQLCESEGDKS